MRYGQSGDRAEMAGSPHRGGLAAMLWGWGGSAALVLFLFFLAYQCVFGGLPAKTSRHPGYETVYRLLSIVYLDEQCLDIEPILGDSIKPGLIECSRGRGGVIIWNINNGTRLRTESPFNLTVVEGTEGRGVVFDAANNFVFFTLSNELLDFRTTTIAEIASFEGHQGPDRIDQFWIQQVSLGEQQERPKVHHAGG